MSIQVLQLLRPLPHHPCTLLLAGLMVATPATAAAQAAAAPAPAASAPRVPVFAPDPVLLQAFGQEAGIRRLAAVFVARMQADARIGHFFEKTKLPEFEKQLGDQLCQVLAGPCVYEGDTMSAAHADLKITRADSLAQVEVLQESMDAVGVPFRAQNQLLARLAPMYRDIITR